MGPLLPQHLFNGKKCIEFDNQLAIDFSNPATKNVNKKAWKKGEDTMSIFTNETNAEIILDGPRGEKYFLKHGDVLEGSNFFKRYVQPRLLTLTVDDGSPWVDGESGSGKVLRSSSVTVLAETDFDDVGNEISYQSIIGGPASFVQISCQSGAAKVRINGDEQSDFLIAADEVQIFDDGDMLIDTLQFSTDFSGGAQTVFAIIATGKPS
jgi:hypothetical protein